MRAQYVSLELTVWTVNEGKCNTIECCDRDSFPNQSAHVNTILKMPVYLIVLQTSEDNQFEIWSEGRNTDDFQ